MNDVEPSRWSFDRHRSIASTFFSKSYKHKALSRPAIPIRSRKDGSFASSSIFVRHGLRVLFRHQESRDSIFYRFREAVHIRCDDWYTTSHGLHSRYAKTFRIQNTRQTKNIHFINESRHFRIGHCSGQLSLIGQPQGINQPLN